jgi:hypothetical protein
MTENQINSKLKTFISQKKLPSFKPVERKYAEWVNSMRDQYESGTYPNIVYNYLTGDISNDNVEWKNYNDPQKSPFKTWSEFEIAMAKRMKKENEGQQEQRRQEVINNSPTISQAPANRPLWQKGIAIATHPLTAFGYSVRNQPMPDYFEKGSVNPIDRALQFAALRYGAPAVMSSAGFTLPRVMTALNTPLRGIPGFTLNNIGWGLGAAYSGNEVLDQNSNTRTSINQAINNPTLGNIVNATGYTLGTGLGFYGLPVRQGLLSLGDDFSRAVTTLPKYAKDAAVTTALSKQLSFGKPRIATPPIRIPRKIDPINRSTVNVQNDFVNEMSGDEYNDMISSMYSANKSAYDQPLIEFKSSKPNSFLEGVGNSNNQKEGLLFKEKYCLPGSECAKSANAFTNRVFTDITGNPFQAGENAHNAWHMEDQMTRHGGINVTNQPIKIGDRILMGNTGNASTYFPGYRADPRVRHAGVFAGYMETPQGIMPMVFESGRNNPAYLNPLSHTFTGPNSVVEAVRPLQFRGPSFGEALVAKNIRYAFRDKPSVATYSSGNSNVQSLFDNAQQYKETIKKTHDLTNDEFDELLNSLIGIGAQETKLNATLPSSFLPKAKINLQNTLLNIGLTKPIKQTLNLTKKLANNLTTVNSSLPEYPGSSFIEMEAAKLSAKENISIYDALNKVKSQYQPKPRFTLSTIEPSKGMFRQKFQTEEGRTSGFSPNITQDDLANGLSQMAQNYNKVKSMYPDASPRQLMDITTLMWNSPGKAANRELVDFYILGKNNPDLNRFNFNYVNKINQFKNKYINIKPRLVEPHLNFVRGNYPEIQYKKGGLTCPEGQVRLPNGQCGTLEDLKRVSNEMVWNDNIPQEITDIKELPEIVIYPMDKETKKFRESLDRDRQYSFDQFVKEYGPVNITRKKGKGVFSGTSGYYNPLTNTINIKPNRFENTDWDAYNDTWETYLSELAHKKQFKERGLVSTGLNWLTSDLPSYAKSKYQEIKNTFTENWDEPIESPYSTPGTVEYEAHSTIEPDLMKVDRKLRNNYYDYITRGINAPEQESPFKKKKQFGGQLSPNENQEFLKNWYTNRKITDPYIQEGFNLDKPEYLKKISSFPTPKIVPIIDNDPRITGRYDREQNQIFLTPNAEPHVELHEQNHRINSDGAGEYMRTIHKDIANNEIKPKSDLSGVYKEKYEYFSNPDELHSRIMVLRQKAGLQPDEFVTKERIQSFLKNYKGDIDNINDILELAKDENALLNMLNYMAMGRKNKSKNLFV